MPIEIFDTTLIMGFIFLIIGLMFIAITTRVKFVALLAVLPCIILMVETYQENPVHGSGFLLPLCFGVIAIFCSAYAFFGTD